MNNIKCLNCFELTSTFSKLDMSPLPSIIGYVYDLEECVDINDFENSFKYDGNVLCSECGEYINMGDYFIPSKKEELFTQKVGMMIGEEISRYVPYCKECEIVQQLMNVNDISVVENGRKLYSEGINVNEFLEYHFVPLKYCSYVIPYLQCRCCGYGYDKMEHKHQKGSFDETFSIFSEDEISTVFEIDIVELSRLANKYQILIQSIELNNFSSFLKRNPMLAFKHSVGKKLYELLSAMFNANDYTVLNNEVFYRGRTRGISSEMYQPSDMWNPPLGVATHGRYNVVGTSVLYLTSDKNFVPQELQYISSQEIDVATIKVEKPLKVLDLSSFIGDFGKFLSQLTHSPNILKPEYLLTNYISECCREIGFNAIKYKGVRDGNYYNCAVLNYEEEKDLKILSVENLKVSISYELTDLVVSY